MDKIISMAIAANDIDLEPEEVIEETTDEKTDETTGEKIIVTRLIIAKAIAANSHSLLDKNQNILNTKANILNPSFINNISSTASLSLFCFIKILYVFIFIYYFS